MGYRKRYRRRSNYKFNRRRFSNSKYGSRRRIIRKCLRRRALRPEVKYLDYSANVSVGFGANATGSVTVSSMALGTGEGNRLAEEIMIRKVFGYIEVAGPTGSGSSNSNFPIESDNYVRIILWSPRVNFTLSNSYMSNLAYKDIIDWNVVTVHKDRHVHVGSRFQVEYGSTGGTISNVTASGAAVPGLQRINIAMPFPRRARFAPASLSGSTALDADKDVLYATYINNFSTLPITINSNMRITYTDA
ncbi:capsid protein [Chifec virus UA13_133]|nr:capsid protein [Chifec virus UA13_133]